MIMQPDSSRRVAAGGCLSPPKLVEKGKRQGKPEEEPSKSAQPTQARADPSVSSANHSEHLHTSFGEKLFRSGLLKGPPTSPPKI